jgi:hypothetical protein
MMSEAITRVCAVKKLSDMDSLVNRTVSIFSEVFVQVLMVLVLDSVLDLVSFN